MCLNMIKCRQRCGLPNHRAHQTNNNKLSSSFSLDLSLCPLSFAFFKFCQPPHPLSVPFSLLLVIANSPPSFPSVHLLPVSHLFSPPYFLAFLLLRAGHSYFYPPTSSLPFHPSLFSYAIFLFLILSYPLSSCCHSYFSAVFLLLFFPTSSQPLYFYILVIPPPQQFFLSQVHLILSSPPHS